MEVDENIFQDAAHKEIFNVLRRYQKGEERIKVKKILPLIPEALLPRFDEILLLEIEEDTLDDEDKMHKEIDSCVARLKQVNLRRKLRSLSLAIKQAGASGNKSKTKILSEEFRDLAKVLSNR